MAFLEPVTLAGHLITLEPLRPEHHDGLVTAVQDGELWNLWYTHIPLPEAMQEEIERRLELQTEGTMLPFVLRRPDTGQVIGMTTYMNADAANRRVEIGSTWLAHSAQRTGINTEAKLLLLTHAFDTLACIAVEFRTHWLNQQSRAAIARLGAKQDGILRNHQRMPDGSLRDTVIFSIIASEWPAVRNELRRRLTTGSDTAVTSRGGLNNNRTPPGLPHPPRSRKTLHRRPPQDQPQSQPFSSLLGLCPFGWAGWWRCGPELGVGGGEQGDADVDERVGGVLLVAGEPVDQQVVDGADECYRR
jgi:RimJ/RimL family protein N-acetyltransferase